MKSLTLETLETFLTEQGYDVTPIEDSETHPYPSLMVYLGIDDKEREYLLEITLKEQLMSQEGDLSAKYVSLQFLLPLPFEVKELATADMARYTNFINLNLDLGLFKLDEINGKVFYSHTQLLDSQQPNFEIITSIIGIIMIYLSGFAESLEKIATEETTFNELLQEAVEAIEEMTKE